MRLFFFPRPTTLWVAPVSLFFFFSFTLARPRRAVRDKTVSEPFFFFFFEAGNTKLASRLFLFFSPGQL